MSYKLKYPYKDNERMNFIVEYNHNKGLRVEEDTKKNLFALEPWEKLEGNKVVSDKEAYNAAQAQKERERINMLSLTAADVERAIYKAKGMDFEDILHFVSDQADGDQATKIDLKALKIELKANNFYRGNPYVEQIGTLLGFTPEMLDRFFESGEWEELVKVEDIEFPPEGGANNGAGQASEISSNSPADNEEVEE